MPYITKQEEGILEAENAGELNFLITELIIDYMKKHGVQYKYINDVIGALEGSKAEFYRRIVIPYEDTKLAVNGDVYRRLYDDE